MVGPCPALPVEALGYNFHTADMPVVATGCVGDVSCESGQTVRGTAGGLRCATASAGHGCNVAAIDFCPPDVVLDPNKHYFISIMPGDGINPTVAALAGR